MHDLVLVDREFPHHGQYSGYKQLGRYLAAQHLLSCGELGWLPERLVRLMPGMHPNWYNPQSFETELAVAGSMLRRGASTFHYLYGESSHKLGGRVNRRLGRSHRVVATFHQLPDFFEQRRRQFEHLRYLDAVILVASTQRDFFGSAVDGAVVDVIPHGVDTHFFQPPRDAKTPNGRLCCLSVGSNYRDFDVHSTVIQNINRSSLPGVEFVAVGESCHANRYAPFENVRYLTDISDEELLAQYQAADLLLVPLRDATACNALLEGTACGLPIVVTDVGAVREYVDDRSAVLTPAGDARSMTDAVIELLCNAERRTLMARNARETALERFDWALVADRVKQVYERIW